MTIVELLAHTALATWLLGSVCRGIKDSVIVIRARLREASSSAPEGLITANTFLASLFLLVIGGLKEASYRLFATNRFEALQVIGHPTATHPRNRPICIVYVPGTWSKASRRLPRIVKFLENSYPSRFVMVFRWQSRNNTNGRKVAAENLALQLSSHHLLVEAKKIYLIGHSHGGSVCAAAASIAQDRRCKVVTLGTPFVEFHGKNAINWGGFSAFFGVLIWPLLLFSVPLGIGIQSVIGMTIPLAAQSIAGLILIVLLIRVFVRITVILESGPIRNYANCINIIADEDVLIKTMEHISKFFDQRGLLLAEMNSTNAGNPQSSRKIPAVWISALVWFSGFISTAYLLLIDSWLAVIPLCAVAFWFYTFPSRRPWQVGYFVPTLLLMANPVAVLMMLSTVVTFGLNVLQVALGRAKVSRNPGKTRCIPVSLVDVTIFNRTLNAHSSMLDSAIVRSELLNHLK